MNGSVCLPVQVKSVCLCVQVDPRIIKLKRGERDKQGGVLFTRHTSHIAGLLRLAVHDDLTVMLPFTAVFPNAAILHKIEES